jgi:hypothetical protein
LRRKDEGGERGFVEEVGPDFESEFDKEKWEKVKFE